MATKAMIMAAGVGTRLDPLTQTVPKPMVPIANTPVIEHILKLLSKFNIKDAIANTHYLSDSIHNRFDNNTDLGINLSYIHEEKLSGTAGGVKKCQEFFKGEENFIVISGDALTDVDLGRLIEQHKAKNAVVTMALKEIDLSEVSHFGVVVVDENSIVTGFQEKPSIEMAKSNLVNTGIYVFNKKIFDYIPENTFYDFAKNVFPALMQNKEILSAQVINDYWNDVGTINQYRLTTYDVLSNKVNISLAYPKTKLGWVSKKANVSKDIKFTANSIIGDNTTVKSNVSLLGNNAIGNNCIIEEGAFIRNSIIWDNVTIEKDTIIDGCIIANNAIIKKNSILSPGCIVAEDCVISENANMCDGLRLNSGETFCSRAAKENQSELTSLSR